MPTITYTDEQFQQLINIVAMSHPLVAEMMKQAQEQGKPREHGNGVDATYTPASESIPR
jgi:hypothetical protein